MKKILCICLVLFQVLIWAKSSNHKGNRFQLEANVGPHFFISANTDGSKTDIGFQVILEQNILFDLDSIFGNQKSLGYWNHGPVYHQYNLVYDYSELEIHHLGWVFSFSMNQMGSKKHNELFPFFRLHTGLSFSKQKSDHIQASEDTGHDFYMGVDVGLLLQLFSKIYSKWYYHLNLQTIENNVLLMHSFFMGIGIVF